MGGVGISTAGAGNSVFISVSSLYGETLTGDSGGAVPATGGNWNTLGSGSITTVGTPGTSTMTFQLTGLTNHSVLVGAGTTTITKVGPVATTGSFLASQGLATDPVFSTATYPLTTAINEILYSSAANTVVGLATANSATLVTTATGVPVFTASMTDGQIVFGDTGGTPTVGSLTSTGGTITITPGAGTLNIDLAGGSIGVDSIAVQAVTAPGVSPVVPDGGGLITINGAAVAAQTIPIQSRSIAVNALQIEVQRGSASAATNATQQGLVSFDSGSFTVDGNGWVTLSGGGLAIDSIHPDSGTDPVVPTAGGLVNIVGSGSTTTVGSLNTLTVQLTGLTNHAVMIGAGTTTITMVGPVAATGNVLMSNGVGSDPAFSTATYPLVTTINQILYSSAANTVVGLATANSAVLVTTSAGVPVWSGTMTDGQLIIGDTSGTPTAANLTAGAGISITNGAGAITIAATSASAPGVTNIGIAYSGGTFTVRSANGSSLSGTNIGYVTLQSKGTPGNLVTIAVTADQTFTDGSGGGLDNARFGVTTGVNWAQDMPYFLYAVMDNTEAAIAFMISRNPCATVSPASTGISKSGSIINVNQADFFCLPNVTITDYDVNPCLCIGSFRMQFAGATDSWTVQTLNTTDGIGNFNDQIVFTFPTGQNGAASGTYILAGAGTEPTWTTNAMVYSIQKNGLVKYNFNGQTANVAGVGAQTLAPILPYAVSSQNQEDSWAGRSRTNATGGTYQITVSCNSSSATVTSIYTSAFPTILYTNASVAANDNLQFVATYRAFTNSGL